MQLNNVNSVAFKARTREGNRYEKSAEGKKFVPLIGIATMGASAIALKKFGILDEIVKPLQEMMKTSEKNVLFSSFLASGLALGALISLPIMIGIGQVVDLFINKTRRKDADKLAQTGIVQGDTNSGKISLGILGVVMAAITAAGGHLSHKLSMEAFSKKMSNADADVKVAAEEALNTAKAKMKTLDKMSKYSKYVSPLVALASWFAYGAVYDHGVNKFRDELDQQKRNYMGMFRSF